MLDFHAKYLYNDEVKQLNKIIMEENRFSGDDFNGFIEELIKNKRLNDTKEEGIAKLVIDQGIETLSDKQKYVFQESISHYFHDECSRCGLEIPWCEMSAAEDNGGLCSWCQQMSRNDKD